MRKSILSQCRPLGPPGRFGARPDHPHLPDGLKLPETTPEERAVLSAHIARRKQKRPSPRVELIEKAGSVELSTDHPIPPLGNALIMESLGTADFDFYDGLLTQLVNVGLCLSRWQLGRRRPAHAPLPVDRVLVTAPRPLY